MLGQGIHIFGRYSYLVNKIKFPLVGIPSIYAVSELVIHAGLVLALVIVYFVCGQGLDIHLVQLPFAILLMVVFWYLFSLTCSCLSALSKDFMNLVKTLSTPLFWLSGIIFDIFALGIGWLTTILAFNPVTFFATFYRCIFYDKIWIWELPETCFGMCVVFLVTLIAALVVYSRTKEEVHDVL
jgi:teichoic acid transport system permease protein